MSNPEPSPSTPKSHSKEPSSNNSSSQWEVVNRGANESSKGLNAAIPNAFQTSTTAAIFRSNTIAPSPPPQPEPANERSNTSLDTSRRLGATELLDGCSSPQSAGLRIHTDIFTPAYKVTPSTNDTTARNSSDSTRKPPVSGPSSIPIAPLARTPSIKNVFANSVGSSSAGSRPGSAISSPMLNAMADVTPLPSPLMSGDSPGPWKKLLPRPTSRDHMLPMTADSALVTASGESISSAIANQVKRRAYQGLVMNASDTGHQSVQSNKDQNGDGHQRNRSISEYVPEAMQVPKPRHITVSGSHAPEATPESSLSGDALMRREPNLAVQRGLAPIKRPPTPPSSRTGGESSDSDSSSIPQENCTKPGPKADYFEAKTRDGTKRRWRGLSILGEGTFSRVMLATSQLQEEEEEGTGDSDVWGSRMDGLMTPVPKAQSENGRKKLVAIKICEHGPKGGASEQRVEMSLKRELEIMMTINHPSLVHLKAWNIEETRAILVLSYCPGGDLFEVASLHKNLLVPSLLRRMFAELIAAVQYLHERHIVHRDIKLENVLVNLPQHELARPLDWQTYPHSVITLTDLGLSRRVADDEKLTTRCGSDDYAAPEVILGQPYDGRATDAWSLGVLLYALLESRLPFDPHPGMSDAQKMRSRTSHRIARVEWSWIEYAGDEGDHEGDPAKFKVRGLEGAMTVTEALLKRSRSRWGLEKVQEEEWVSGGTQVEGGIKFREEATPEPVQADIDASPL